MKAQAEAQAQAQSQEPLAVTKASGSIAKAALSATHIHPHTHMHGIGAGDFGCSQWHPTGLSTLCVCCFFVPRRRFLVFWGPFSIADVAAAACYCQWLLPVGCCLHL